MKLYMFIILLLILISSWIVFVISYRIYSSRQKEFKKQIEKLTEENRILHYRITSLLADPEIDFDSLPWAELLNYKNPTEDFFRKYNLIPIDVLDYIWVKCNEGNSQSELFWKIFHFIRDEVCDAAHTLDYRRFCWIQCKKKPLLFYERHCKGDKLAFKRYFDAWHYDPWGFPEEEFVTRDDTKKIVQNICVLIRNAKDLQKDDTQRNKDASMLEEYIK